MIYPTKFSVMFNTRSRKSSVRVFVNNEKIVSILSSGAFTIDRITPVLKISPVASLATLHTGRSKNDLEREVFYLLRFQ